MKEKFLIIFLLGIVLIPSSALSAVPIFEIDMDPGEPGVQSNILLSPGDTFTTDVLVTLPDSTASLSSFGYSIRWDNMEIVPPDISDVTTYIMSAEWTDLQCWTVDIINYLIVNCVQLNQNYSEGPLTAVVSTITWTTDNPVTDSTPDIEVGFFDPLDGAYDKDGNSITPIFLSGEVDYCLRPARIAGASPVYYDYVQNAYDNSVTGDTIEIQDALFVENLIADHNISIIIEAGYDCDYNLNPGMTTINGDMIISDGSVTINSGTFEVR